MLELIWILSILLLLLAPIWTLVRINSLKLGIILSGLLAAANLMQLFVLAVVLDYNTPMLHISTAASLLWCTIFYFECIRK